METPLSSKRITTSQAMASNNTIPISKTDQKGVSKSLHRSALFDITNDSPIVGLATGNLSTPSSKKRSVISSQCIDDNIINSTPGSGEALLRSQVKSLLQKVQEEGEILKFTHVDGPFAHLKGLIQHNSPMCLLAPTPNNTPLVNGTQILEKNDLVSGTSTPVLEQVSITKMVKEMIERQKKREEESLIKRSLLFDFYEKSEEVSSNSSDCVSTVTYQGDSAAKQETTDDNERACTRRL